MICSIDFPKKSDHLTWFSESNIFVVSSRKVRLSAQTSSDWADAQSKPQVSK